MHEALPCRGNGLNGFVRICLFAVMCLAVCWGQTPADRSGTTWYVPALGYGSGAWSILRISNRSALAETVRVEVYRESGERIPLEPQADIAPGATREIRIDGPSSTDQLCWAKVVQPPGNPPLEIQASIEILRGNVLEEFVRRAHRASSDAHWVTRSAAVEGKSLYFLNAGNPTVVSFCTAKKPSPDECGRHKERVARFPLKRGQALSIQVRKLRRPFFITESSAPGAAVLVMFDDSPGRKSFFSSDSSIQFDEPLK